MNSEAEEKAQQENEERTDEIEETIGDPEKEKLFNENRRLKDQVRAYQQRFGDLGEIDTTTEFERLGIQESSEYLVENVREKEKEVDLWKVKYTKLQKEKAESIKVQERYKKLSDKRKVIAIRLIAENKVLKAKLERYQSIEEDYEDGANKAEGREISIMARSRPTELVGFRNCYNCEVSCVSRVVFFIFFYMKLPVCVRKFEREVQNTLNEISIECEIKVEVEACSLAIADFHGVSIIEPKISEQITDVDNIDNHLEKAIETMREEPHPALFIMHYKSSNRIGHCFAITPDLKFIDVGEKCYWFPEKYPHWESVSKIEVWKVEKEVAEKFEEKCSVRKCENECIRFAPNPGEAANELS